jgi:tripartite-type tricarboxylate transporter receptor subunit TctC
MTSKETKKKMKSNDWREERENSIAAPKWKEEEERAKRRN